MSGALHLEDSVAHGSVNRSDTPTPAASCEAVRFYGRELHVALTLAAEYLRDWESVQGYPPAVVALHDEFSWEDSGGDIAWQLTLVLRDGVDAYC